MTELPFGRQVERQAMIMKVARVHRRRRLKSKTVLALKYRIGWGAQR